MRSRIVGAWIVGGIGVVFLGQGLGLIPGSVMTGDPFWAVVGAVMAVGAGVVVWWARRQR